MDRLDIYKCNICGNIVEVMVSGGGELICCGENMQKLEPQSKEDSMMEKHVPILFENNDGTEIRVGEVLHPMLPEHYIMFIQAISKDRNFISTKFLSSSDEPKMILNEVLTDVIAREYCNIHGLWENNNDK